MKDCLVCSRTAASSGAELKSCSLCRGVRYCSLECQKSNWPNHKLTCSGWKEGTAKKKNKPLYKLQKQLQDLTVDATRCARNGERIGEGNAYCNMANVYIKLGQSFKAVELHQKYLKIAQELGDRAAEGSAYGNLANAHYLLAQFDKALKCQEECLKIALEVGDKAGEGGAYGNLGATYDRLGQFDKAAELHRKNLKIALKMKNRAEEGRAYCNLGSVYCGLGQFDKSAEFYGKSRETALEVGDRAGEGKVYSGLGNANYLRRSSAPPSSSIGST